MRDVHAWLKALGLSQYSRVFAENEIDADALPELKDADLREIGIPLGHRKRILKRIRQLESEADKPLDDEARSEHRLLTILFVDIVASTSFAQRLDPEDLADLFNAFHATSRAVVERFGGFVARNLGDGLVAYFGWPESHEHDAERAVLTALKMIEAVKAIPIKTPDLIQLHIAAATGRVVVGEVLRMDSERVHEVFGALPSLAARLQSLSAPDTILISDETRRLIEHKFVCVPLGRKKLRGFQELVPVSQVIGHRVLSLNFEARSRTGLTPLIGRAAEVDLMQSRWERASARDGQVLLLGGEPGIGKSRLCAELQSSLHGRDATCLSFQCSPFHKDSPLYPVARCICQLANLSDDDSAEARRQKLKALFESTDDAGISLLAAYLSASVTGSGPLRHISPERQRMALHRLLVDFVLMLARRQSVLITFEDAHWMDPTTSEFLDALVNQVAKEAVLLVITFRPAFLPSWQESENRTLLNLKRLTRDQSAQLIEASANAGKLPRNMIAEIVERSDGNPLFIEELTAAVLGRRQMSRADTLRDQAASPASSIPSTLQESLLARIDQTSARARELIQLCAVVGRRFSYAQISAMSDARGPQLDETLAELAGHGLLHVTGHSPNPEYTFKHALIQDAAYSTIVREKRQRLHAQCATTLKQHFASLCENDPNALGLHYELSGNAQAAIPCFLAAGQRAIERSALAEADTALQRGLSLLDGVPDGEWKDSHELKFRSLLGRACIFAKGWADPSVKSEYGRALELAEALGVEREQVPLEWALATYHLLRGEMREAVTGGYRVLELAEHENDQGLLHVAHSALAIYQFYGGDFVSAISHVDQALRFYRPEASDELRRNFGTDRRLQALRGASLSHWCLGDHQKALDLDDEQLSLARSSGRPFEYNYALTISCILHSLRRDGLRTLSFATEAIEIAQDQGYSFLEANARNFQAIAMALQQPSDTTLKGFDEAIEAYQLAGNRMGISSMLAIMAELCGRMGYCERGLRYVDKALIYVKRYGERFAQSDLYRVKGELLRVANRTDDAKNWLNRAVRLAQKQRAKTWEMQASVPLARLLFDQSEFEKARGLLAPWRQDLQTLNSPANQLLRAHGIRTQWLAVDPPARPADQGSSRPEPRLTSIKGGRGPF